MKSIKRVLLLVLLFAVAGLAAQAHAGISLAQDSEPTYPQGDSSVFTTPDTAEFPTDDLGLPYQYPIVTYQSAESPAPRSPSAVVINVWYGATQSFGQQGIPQSWVNILGSLSGHTPATTLSYRLNGGDPLPLSIGPNNERLYDDGDFNVEIAYNQFVPGANTVEITADDNGMQTTQNVTVNYTPGVDWPRNYAIDWSTAPSIGEVAQIVDGQWEISGGELRTVVPGYDRAVAIGGLGWTDYEVTVPVTIESLNSAEWGPPSNGAGVGFIASWTGHYALDGEQPRAGWRRSLGAIAWHRWNINGVGGFLMRGFGGGAVLDNTNDQIQLGTTYIFKLSVQSSPIEGFPATYRFKYWEQGTPEPALWTMQGTGVVGEPASGSLLLVAHQAMARFGNVTVNPIPTANNLKVNVQAITNGEVIVEPDKENYTYGEQVTVRAVGDSGFVLSGWSGDLTTMGTTNPVVFDITENMTFRANFVAGANPTMTVTTSGNGSVMVSPEKNNYQYGEIVTLTPQPNSGYLFAGWGGDLSGAANPAEVVMNSNMSISANFVPADVNSPVSDDFSACDLNTGLWTFINPVGDGSYEMSGDKLVLNVPEGLSHNIWLEGNRSVRMMQPTNDENFEIITQFDSVVTQRFQMQGILVQQDANNFLRFEVHHDGKTVQAYAAIFEGGVPTPIITREPLAGTPAWLRVTRTGTSWSFSYSFDGTNFQSAGSFDHDLNVTTSGVFGGNHNSEGSIIPAHQAVVDYFFNSASPIVPEDGQANSININVVGQGSVIVDPDQDLYACGETVSLTANPAPGWQFFAWSGDLSGNAPQRDVVVNGPINATATFIEEGSGGGFKLYMPSVLR